MLVTPCIGPGAIGLWAGGVLIDTDHYLWFCVCHRRLSPLAAVREFNQAHAPQHPATRFLHSPRTLLAVALLAALRPRLRPLATGMTLHVALDSYHEARMGLARAHAMERDDSSCQGCGAQGSDVGTHLRRQPWLLPSYEAGNLVSLCGRCHEIAHERHRGFAWPR